MSAAVAEAPTAPTVPAGFLSRLFGRPTAWLACAWLLAILLLGVFCNQVVPLDPLDQDLLAVKQYPSAEHWLGTDDLGRDVAARVLHGVVPTFVGMLQALTVAGVLGLGLGLSAGYFGGKADAAVSRLTDLFQALPLIVIALAVLTVFNRSMLAAMVTFGILGSAGITRVVRSAC